MSIKIEYICDKCGIVQTDGSQFCSVGVGFGNYQSILRVSDKHKLQVCRKCLEGYGLVVEINTRKIIPNPPSTEDLIVDILSSLGVKFEE